MNPCKREISVVWAKMMWFFTMLMIANELIHIEEFMNRPSYGSMDHNCVLNQSRLLIYLRDSEP